MPVRSCLDFYIANARKASNCLGVQIMLLHYADKSTCAETLSICLTSSLVLVNIM